MNILSFDAFLTEGQSDHLKKGLVEIIDTFTNKYDKKLAAHPVWASSKYEEINTKVYELFKLLSVFPQSSRVNKIKVALEDLNRLNREEGTQY